MSIICKYLAEEIHFAPTRIVPCGANVWDRVRDDIDTYFLKPDIDQNGIDFDLYFNKRKDYIEQFKNGKTPEFCVNCEKFTPVNYNDDECNELKIKKINIYNRTICSCRCVYCCLAAFGKMDAFKKMNSDKNYDINPILKQIDDLHLIEEGSEIAILGGECSEYPDELENVVNWGKKYNPKFIILSNGIIYNDTIASLLSSGKVELKISLDCGSKAKHEQIKRVKAFDRVIQNLEKYSKKAENNPNAQIQLRYLILPKINDNIKDVKNFLNIARKYKINKVVLSIEREWMEKNNQKQVPSHLRKFIKFCAFNKEYKDIHIGFDKSHIWDWWLEKVLNEKTIFDKLKMFLNNNNF